MRHRQEFIDHADEPEVANPAKDEFDRGQRRSVTLLMAVLFLLLGIILFSGNITPRTPAPLVRPQAPEVEARVSDPVLARTVRSAAALRSHSSLRYAAA